jgi:UDP-N-acetylmuramate dehydrogenase
MKFTENVSLSQFSNYKIGGVARFFFEPKNEREVGWAIAEAKARKLPIFILGGGTNVLLSDGGFYGLVLRPVMDKIKKISPKKRNDGYVIEIGAGISMAKLLHYSIAQSLSGLEWAGGLPGTLGGAIRGNAGCFGGEIKDAIVSVRSFDMKKMKVVERSAKACAFGYRDSIFKKNGELILSATLTMIPGDKKEIAKAIREKIEYRKQNHPLEYPNIGSIFKNVPLAAVYKETSKNYKTALAAQSLHFRGSQFSVKTDPFPVISTAKLISETGLRGVSFGGAMISGKHPNFIVNVLRAGSEDVKNLISLAKAQVKEKFGLRLEEEVQIV